MVASPTALTALRAAIRQRHTMEFRAKGHTRTFSPHVLGTKDGQWRVFGWQSSGGSAGGLKSGGDWRCFAVADLADLRTRPDPWQAGEQTGEAGLRCVDLIDTAADLAHAAQSLARRKRRPHER